MYVADEATRAQKRRAVEAACASAVLNGCDPDDVRQWAVIGIADGVALNNGHAVADLGTTVIKPAA